MENVVENNKLIAEFMGCKIMPKHAVYMNKKFDAYTWDIDNVHDFGRTRNYYGLSELSYHESFDWLMPVVEKIESMGYWVEIMGGAWSVVRIGKQRDSEYIVTSNSKINVKINSAYNSVIQFIKWHNSQPNQNQ